MLFFSLPLLQSILLFHLFTIWFCCFFAFFDVLFIPKKKKYRNCGFYLFVSPFFETIHQKCFLTFSLQKNLNSEKSFLSCRCLFLFFVFAFSNIKENFPLPFVRPLFVFLFISSDFSSFSFLTSFVFSSPFFSFSFFFHFILCVFFLFLFFIPSGYFSFFSFLPSSCTFTSPVLCIRLFDPKKIVLTCLLVFRFLYWFSFSKKKSPFSSKKHFCFRHY